MGCKRRNKISSITTGLKRFRSHSWMARSTVGRRYSIVADRGGILNSGGVYEDLQMGCPELSQSVCDSFSYYKKRGCSAAATADSQPWIAWLLASLGRVKWIFLEKAEKIQREVKVPFK